MGDVGDGDDQAERRPVRFGEDGVVEVARVGAVDGDQRDVAQVLAAAERHGARLRASANASSGKSTGMSWVWMAMRLIALASPILPRRSMTRAGFRPMPLVRQWLGQHELARFGAGAWSGGTFHSALDRRSVGSMRPSGLPCR